MGENNDVPVTVGSFFINRYEVSQDEWYVIMGNNPSNQHKRDFPVDQINWYDARRFTQRLSELSGLPFRLPFEAEWEYAARGGLNTKNFIYSGSNNPEQVAWFREKYNNIPDSYRFDSEEDKNRFIETISKLTQEGSENNPEHNYLLGLAYLDGIDVEVNKGYALKLFEKAHKSALLEATKQLAKMYVPGNGGE